MKKTEKTTKRTSSKKSTSRTFDSFTKVQLVLLARKEDTHPKPTATNTKAQIIDLLKKNSVKVPKTITA